MAEHKEPQDEGSHGAQGDSRGAAGHPPSQQHINDLVNQIHTQNGQGAANHAPGHEQGSPGHEKKKPNYGLGMLVRDLGEYARYTLDNLTKTFDGGYDWWNGLMSYSGGSSHKAEEAPHAEPAHGHT